MPESNKQDHPVLSVSIDLKTESYRQSLHWTLTDIAQQDSTLKVEIESDGHITLFGRSWAHLESICERIWNEYKIEIEVGQPQVLYLETIRKEAEAEGKYIRQTGGTGNYGHCKIRLTPSTPDSGYKFINEISNGAIPELFIEPIDQGIREALKGGIFAGYPVVDLIVTLLDGSYHDTDSNEIAYKIAGSIAFKEATRKANPVVLEPLMTAFVAASEELLEVVIKDLNNRRGHINSIERGSGCVVVRVTIPISETLPSSKYGRFDCPMYLVGYESVFRDEDPGDDAAGIPAIKPNLPIAGIRSAAIPLDTQFD